MSSASGSSHLFVAPGVFVLAPFVGGSPCRHRRCLHPRLCGLLRRRRHRIPRPHHRPGILHRGLEIYRPQVWSVVTLLDGMWLDEVRVTAVIPVPPYHRPALNPVGVRVPLDLCIQRLQRRYPPLVM